MPKAIVLGGGMIGSVIAADLAADPDFSVTLTDRDPVALKRACARCGDAVETVTANLGDPSKVKTAIEGFDIVLGALSSTIGYQTLRAVIEAGRNYCDISFMREDAWELNELARSNGVTAIVDCGLAPGMSNLLAGYAATQQDPCDRIDIYVGGLPCKPQWPFRYKAAYSPHDVIEFYCRPARVVENGEVVVKEALSENEEMEFPEVGRLEAFNTDGLRSLIEFLDVPNMCEKTYRYPGHAELMRALRDSGFFSTESVEVGGQNVRPLGVTTALLIPQWKYKEGEEDLVAFRVVAEGVQDSKRTRMTWDMVDYYDRKTKTTSMARTTAYPCTTFARLLASGQITQPGVLPPERLASQPGLVDLILDSLANRGIKYKAKVEEVS